ncbi:MAG: GGDEF domain-containing protein [bacterium]|nr:GGDEF domain-containing protein [bacterium]
MERKETSNTLVREHCDFSCTDKLCVTLDKAGVPADSKWRSLVLYMRDLKDHDYLSDGQKAQIHDLLKELISSRQYTERGFQKLVSQQEKILSAPYVRKLEETVRESERLIDDFQKLMQRRQGDIKKLETKTVTGIESGKDPREMIKDLRTAFHDVVTVMEKDVSELDKLSKTDVLTGLNNRRALDDYLQGAADAFLRDGRPHSLVMLDIDHFKKFNDTYGHQIGDQALATVSKILREKITEFADREQVHCFGARYGGEEFSVIIPETTLEAGLAKAEEIRESIENYNFIIRDASGEISHKGIKITASIGVAEMKQEWAGARV